MTAPAAGELGSAWASAISGDALTTQASATPSHPWHRRPDLARPLAHPSSV